MNSKDFLNKKFQFVKQQELGQVTVEYILLAVVLITMFQLMSKVLREGDYLKEFQDKPNQVMVNIIENGNWLPKKEDSQSLHPNHHVLHYTPDSGKP